MLKLILAWVILFVAIGIIICMFLRSICDLEKDIRKEYEDKARRYAKIWAERRYQSLIRHTEFKVKQQMVISNESDIEWQ